MPERPKRRKNNKNKRKNKNPNRSDLNKSKDVENCGEEENLNSPEIINDSAERKYNAHTSQDICNDSNIEEQIAHELTTLKDNKEESNLKIDDNKVIVETPLKYETIRNEDMLDVQNCIVESVEKNGNTYINSKVKKQIAHEPETVKENEEDGILEKDDTDTTVETSLKCKEICAEDVLDVQNYIVESPEQSIIIDSKNKNKLGNISKSKSLDNEDVPKITEITEDLDLHESANCSMLKNCSNILISDAESDIDWEHVEVLEDSISPKNKDVAVGTLSIQTIPLSKANECKQILSNDEESSLRQYLQTLKLSNHPESIEIQTEFERTTEVKHRLKKKSLPNDCLLQRSRFLDVIDEEGSSESSLASRRQSGLNVSKSDFDDLEDDVFIKDISEKKKVINKNNITNSKRAIEQECFLVGAKMVDPVVSEARGDWSLKEIEKMTGAEVVYLTDSSSSASDIYDIDEESSDAVETDSSIRIITPTIEAIDADHLLKNQFLTSTVVDNSIQSATNQMHTNNDKLESNSISNDLSNNKEIVVDSTENIKTSLYVLDPIEINTKEDTVEIKCKDSLISSDILNENSQNFKFDNITDYQKELQSDKMLSNLNDTSTNSDTEIKALKNELSNAFSNLIKEVSDSENDAQCSTKCSITRQDSSSSVCSSQCTAKYNPNHSSLNDITNIMHDENVQHDEDTKNSIPVSSHVKDVFEYVTGAYETKEHYGIHKQQPLTLRNLCVKRIKKFPYGEKILQELANVSECLQNFNIYGHIIPNAEKNHRLDINNDKMPYYPLPDVSSIDKVVLPTKSYESSISQNLKPPPVNPRNSSLRKSNDEPLWTGLPTKNDPVYVCLSPSQKMLMEKTNTVITKEDATQLVDMHKKYVDRRGYNECIYKENNEYKQNDANSIAIPFKSQTGSRLLALIRDPSVTNNVQSKKHKSFEHLHDSIEQSNRSFHHYGKEYVKNNLFKPIPPPRLKKYSSSFYESDESSDFTDNSIRSVKSEKKFFHYSTGNLNKDIENDISSIQNMYRQHLQVRDKLCIAECPRRPSLPKDLCEKQMEYIRQKEQEITEEINRLETKQTKSFNVEKRPRAPLLSDKELLEEKYFDINNYQISRKRDVALQVPNASKKSNLFSSSQEELMRDKMYTEYVSKMAERQERKEQKVIKITKGNKMAKSLSSLDILDSKVNNRIEEEFITKARERWHKLGIRDPETEDEGGNNVYCEPKIINHKIKVIEDSIEKEVQQLPNHLQEFVKFTAKNKEQGANSPGESTNGPSAHVTVFCVVILFYVIIRIFLTILKNK